MLLFFTVSNSLGATYEKPNEEEHLYATIRSTYSKGELWNKNNWKAGYRDKVSWLLNWLLLVHYQ